MVVGEGFEPSKLSWQIYSLLPLTAREPHPREGAHSCFAHSPCQLLTHFFEHATLKNKYNRPHVRMVPAPGIEPGTY